MLKRFYPDIDINSIYELPLDYLKSRGINTLFFDIDNTIVPYDIEEASEKEILFFQMLKNEGFKICLVSNNTPQRTDYFNKDIGAYTLPNASKPLAKKLNRMFDEIGCKNSEAALVGDQLFTDVWCAHNAKILAVHVAPICTRDQFQTKIKRGLERIVYKKYLKWKASHKDQLIKY